MGDLGLPQSFQTSIAHSIREQIDLYIRISKAAKAELLTELREKAERSEENERVLRSKTKTRFVSSSSSPWISTSRTSMLFRDTPSDSESPPVRRTRVHQLGNSQPLNIRDDDGEDTVSIA